MATFTGTAGADKFIGTAEDDTYEVNSTGDIVIEAADGGTDTVRSSVSITLRANVEDLLLLEGATKGIGNALDNEIAGNDAANLIDGREGADTMAGGGGNDVYYVDNAGDFVIEAASGGYDRVQARTNYVLAPNVEKLILIGAAALEGTGNAGANLIIGNSFDNLLDGGAGADVLRGGAGDDTYVVDNKADKIAEVAGRGTDTVRASITWKLGSNLENLVLTGAAALRGYGNALDNRLTGNDGANILDGGLGADAMAGGLGNDTYVLDNLGDSVSEAAGAGFDTVRTALSHVLEANVEALILTGKAAIDGTGNALGNQLTGNAMANRLDGLEGADTMTGGLGDDTYIVDNAADRLIEVRTGGFDKVESSVSYKLPDFVDQLTLTGSAVSATGNAQANVLIGTAGDNVLDGGAGNDMMVGGAGDDTYYVDTVSDRVEEQDGGGTDIVYSSSGFTMLDDNVENLVLLGTANLQGAGNALDNTITGNSGNNVLTARGGHDTLIGGKGDDTFLLYGPEFTLIEKAGEGTDTVLLTGSWDSNIALPDNIENVTVDRFYSINQSLIGNKLDNTLTGNNTANYIDGGPGADLMRGMDGSDTYVVDNAGDVIEERYGSFGEDKVLAQFDYVLAIGLEDLTLVGPGAKNGTGNLYANVLTGNALANVLDGLQGEDQLFGMAGNDTLIGGDGSDTLDGGTGGDVMRGGTGEDTYFVDNALDQVIEAAGEGEDLVNATLSWVLADNVDDLLLVGPDALNGTGNALNNVITGNAMANEIDGKAGADRMIGWEGDDTYHVDSDGDEITETAAWGAHDKVIIEAPFAGTYVLQNYIEDLTIAEGASPQEVRGNTQANVMTGNSGANRIDGGGGLDTLIGGAGDDTYVLRAKTDKIIELAGGGSDTIEAGFAISLIDNIENLTLTGTAALNATGNAGDNVLTGNAGANVLTGLGGNDRLDGGQGTDTMRGGTGDDTYVVDNAEDIVTEKAGEGRDTVLSGIDWTLGANLENLTLTGTAVSGTGNALDNTITGNDAANVLSGGGGKDVLIGGKGDDSYIVDAAGVTVIEAADGGGDRIIFTVSGTMGANVEVGVAAGTAAISITGSAGDEILGGNNAANVIDGGGGADVIIGQSGADTLRGGEGDDVLFGDVDSDTLSGGAGKDEFIVGAYSALGVDRITDFASGSDTLLVINPFVTGELLADALVQGTSAQDANDFFIYDSGSGNLWIDYDANGSDDKILLATFTPGTTLLGSDLVLITESDFNAQIGEVEAILVI